MNVLTAVITTGICMELKLVVYPLSTKRRSPLMIKQHPSQTQTKNKSEKR